MILVLRLTGFSLMAGGALYSPLILTRLDQFRATSSAISTVMIFQLGEEIVNLGLLLGAGLLCIAAASGLRALREIKATNREAPDRLGKTRGAASDALTWRVPERTGSVVLPRRFPDVVRESGHDGTARL